MQALILADRTGTALAPLDRHYAVALLPVAGKPLILYCVEDLVGAGLRDLTFVFGAHAARLEALLGDGRRWGARFRFVLSRGDEVPSQLWPRLALGGGRRDPLLVLRGDLLRGPCVATLLAAASTRPAVPLCALPAHQRAALHLLPQGAATAALDGLAAALAEGAPPTIPTATVLPLTDLDINLLADLPAYHRANLDVVAGRFRGLAPAGREVALGLLAGRHARVAPRSLKQGRAYVGENSRVSPRAELLGEVVIDRNVVVDRGVTLYDSLVLPYSYLGELIEVGHAIVDGETLIRVDTGAVLTLSVPDAFMLGRLDGAGAQARAPRWRDRMAGVLLLALSLPLWPLALLAVAGWPAQGRGLLQAEPLLGNREQRPNAVFTAWRWRTRIPLLATLPRLLAVIQGDLRLFGVAPLTPAEADARTEDWQHARDPAPVGLLGPTQCRLPAAAPLDERLLSDACYAAQRGTRRGLTGAWQQLGQHLGEGLLALFSARAWQAHPEP